MTQPEAPPAVDGREETQVDVGETVERIRHKLLDLTLRNKLLSYQERVRSIRIVDELPDAVFHDLVEARRGFEFLPAEGGEESAIDLSPELPEAPADPEAVAPKHSDRFLQTSLAAGRLDLRLRELAAEARRAIEETGSNTLYLAFGFLYWQDKASGKDARAPLILLPVTLRRTRVRRGDTVRYKYVLSSSEEDLEENLCLAEKLLRDFDLVLPYLEDENDEPLSPECYFEKVTATVADRAGWRVARELILDLFSFSKLFLYRDLDELRWPVGAAPKDHPLVRQLVLGSEDDALDEAPEVYAIDEHPGADGLPLLFDADSTQVSAILDALEGHDMVLEGPPGTGKSQTICNLIAAFLEAGKTVLFLSEKLAALQVVKARLDEVELGPFVLELHSTETNKRHLLANLQQRIQHRYPKASPVPDERRERDALRDELNGYAEEMNLAVGRTGLTAFDVFWELERCRGKVGDLAVVDLPEAVTWDRADFRRRAEVVAEIAGHLAGGRVPRHEPWYGVYPVELTPLSRPRLAADLERFRERLVALDDQFEPLVAMIGQVPDRSFAALQRFARLDRGVFVRLPAGFDQDRCHILSMPAAARDLRDFAARIEAIFGFRETAGKRLRDLERLDEEGLAELRRNLERTTGYGLAEMPFGHLVEALSTSERIHDRLAGLRQTLGEHLDLGYDLPRTFGELRELSAFLTFVVEETPVEASFYLSKKLFRGEVLRLVRRARDEAEELLRRDGRKLAAKVPLERMPPIAELEDILTALEAPRSFWGRLSKEYRDALARWHRIDRKPRQASQVVELCRSVLDFFKKRRELVDSTEYREGLDWIFRGLDTDWEQAERIATWADNLVQRTSSQKYVDRFREDFDRTLTESRELHVAARDVVEEVPALARRLGELARGLDSDLLILAADDDAPLFATLARLEQIRALGSDLVPSLEAAVVSRAATLRELTEALALERRARQAILALEEQRTRWRELLGEEYAGEHTEIAVWRAHLGWHEALHAAVPATVAEWLLAADTVERGERLRAFCDNLQTGAGTLDEGIALFRAYGRLEPERFFASLQLPEIIAKVEACEADLENVLGWADYCRACDEARALNLGPLVEAFDEGRLSETQAVDGFELAYYGSLAHHTLESRPLLNTLTRERQAVVSERFRHLDRQCQLVDRHRVIRKLKTRRPPSGVQQGPIRQRTEMGLIRREINKSRNHVPIRTLVKRAGAALLAMKPCFMTSPLSTARYLPAGSLTFDVLIMDEASQLRPEECLGAIARARQVIIVGDPKQLPPTTFFDSAAEEVIEPDDETLLDDVESILDIALQTWSRERRLSWHYRSQHQDLVRFSNHHFYQDTLTVFPSPRPRANDLGVELVSVDSATFFRGTNPVEAEAVVTDVLRHMTTRPDETLGVVAFNGRQRDLILSTIDQRLAREPELLGDFERFQTMREPFFVKNLENVQGDERDVILVSGTYGPDPETGKVYQRFGPITQERGWRRLNVIFTRARRQLRLFASFAPEAVKLTDKTSEGARMLRAYLEYARDTRASAVRQGSEKRPANAFQRALVDFLDELGYEAHVDVGVSGCFLDLAVLDPEHPGEYALGILSDGPHYRRAACSRDRDRLRHEVLRRLGWRLVSIVTSDWFKNRERNRQLLVQELARHGGRHGGRSAPRSQAHSASPNKRT